MTEKLTEAAVSEQPLDDKRRQLVQEVYERFEVFSQGCKTYHEEAQTVREILRLRDPFQDAKDAKEKTLQLNTLKSTFNNCVADQMQNMPEPRILPETPELEQYASSVQDIVRHVIYDVNNYEALHRRRAEDLYGPGTAVTQVVWDETMASGKGDIALIRWPIEAFLWDPQAENIQDARALMKVSWHPMSWYKAHYPDLAQYVSDETCGDDTGLPESQRDNLAADEGRAKLIEYWYRTYDARTRRYTINVAYCAGGALLDWKENVFMHGLYPFVLDVHSTIEGLPVGEGMVSELVPTMRYINRYARYIDTNLRMSSKGRMLTRRNSGIDRNALADWSQDIIEGDHIVNGEDWGWLQHAPLNGMVVSQMLQMQTDLKQDSGANQFTRGETTGGVVSGKAIAALQESGGKITGLRTDTLNNGFREIVTQVLWLVAEFYDDDRIIMVTGRDGKPRQVNMDAKKYFGHGKAKGAILPPPYTVQVEVNKRNPVRVEAQNEMFIQAYTMAAQAQQYFPLSSLFEIMNIDGKDRLLPIIRANEEKQNVMAQLQQQNEQMMEQLAKMQKENDNLRMMASQLTGELASMAAARGGGFTQGAQGAKAAMTGGGDTTSSALVNQARAQISGNPAL